MKFEGNIALVVGSATGMGRATVIKLVKEGAHVIAFDLLGDTLAELKEELKDEAGSFEPFVGDVNEAEKRHGVIAFIQEKYGRFSYKFERNIEALALSSAYLFVKRRSDFHVPDLVKT